MKKQVKVLATAALLAMGATMTSFAAEKGTWDLVDGEWVCYDEDGDLYENEWCLSNGVEYYVGDDGIMVTNDWVEDGDDMYFVNSAGQKVVNEWRFVTPYDDEDEDEQWYYFGSKGKKVTSAKKVINGNTYYFDNDGVMLTGWVDKVAYDEAETIDNAVYTDENGARVKNTWIKEYAPGIDEDEDDVDEDDMNWYYIGSKGAAKTGKVSNINGATYFFNEEGVMLSGWVAASGSNYVEIGGEDQTEKVSAYDEVYFCGDEDDGHAKKNTWVKTWKNTQYDAADADNSQKWFWIAKDGKVYIPGTTETEAIEVTFEDGEAAEESKYSYDDLGSVEEKKINGEVYLFNANGEMISGLVSINGKTYYYGGSNDGAKKDGSQTIEDECGVSYKFYFSTEDKDEQGYYDNAGVTGAKAGKLYNNGLLVTSGDSKYAVIDYVNDVNYIVNKSGSIQTSSKTYKDDDEEIINAEDITFSKTPGVLKGSF